MVLSAVALSGCCIFSGPRYSGARSRNFDGSRFHNPMPVEEPGAGKLLKWQITRKPGHWNQWTDAPRGTAPPRRVTGKRLRVTFINHSTVLIQTAGLNFLTDPVWSHRTSPVTWAGPSRVRPPGIRFKDLPPIHVVLISHNHYDHMDQLTIERLHQVHDPIFIVGLGNARLLRSWGVERVWEIDWWHYYPMGRGGVRVVSVPAQHFSGRGLCDRNSTLWSGYVITGPGGPIYFAGDTGYGPHFQQINQVYGRIRLAILPIGASSPRWFMSRMHISPAEAVRAHQVLKARTSLAIHHGTFQLSDDAEDDPPRELTRALRAAGIPPRHFWVLGFGEGREVPLDGPWAKIESATGSHRRQVFTE